MSTAWFGSWFSCASAAISDIWWYLSDISRYLDIHWRDKLVFSCHWFNPVAFFGFPMGKSSLNIHIRHLLQLDTEPFYSWGMWSWAPLPWCFLASSPWPASSKRNWPHCRWSPRDRPWTAWANYAARGCTPPATGNTSTGWGHKSFGWYGEKWREDMVINLVMLACFLTDCWIYLIYLLLIVDDRISFFLGRSWGRIFQLRKLDESRLKVTDLWRIWLGILMLVLSRYAMVSTI